MTDDQKTEIMRDVLESLAAARKNRAALIAQARKYRESMKKWCGSLDDLIGDNEIASSIDQMAVVNRVWPSEDDLTTMMREIQECNQAIANGNETLRKWNVID